MTLHENTNINETLTAVSIIIGWDCPSSQCPALKTEDNKHSFDRLMHDICQH